MYIKANGIAYINGIKIKAEPDSVLAVGDDNACRSCIFKSGEFQGIKCGEMMCVEAGRHDRVSVHFVQL